MSGSVGIIANQSDAVKRGIAGIEKWIFVGARHETWDAGLDMRQQTWVTSHVSCLVNASLVSCLASNPDFPCLHFRKVRGKNIFAATMDKRGNDVATYPPSEASTEGGSMRGASRRRAMAGRHCYIERTLLRAAIRLLRLSTSSKNGTAATYHTNRGIVLSAIHSGCGPA